MTFHETNPPEKMPCEEKFEHIHYVCLYVQFGQSKDQYTAHADLSEYYKWAELNGIEMEHNLIMVGGANQKSKIMFVFGSEWDAAAFKLRWI